MVGLNSTVHAHVHVHESDAVTVLSMCIEGLAADKEVHTCTIIEVMLVVDVQLLFVIRSHSRCEPKHARGTSLAQLVKQGMEF